MTFQDDLLALELRVLRDAAGDFLVAVAELRRMLVTSTAGARRRLAGIAITDFEGAIRQGILDAHQLGAAQGLSDAAKLSGLDQDALKEAEQVAATPPERSLITPTVGLTALTTGAVTASLALLSTGSPPVEALAPVFGAANTVRGVITSQVNLAANKAVAAVAERVSAPLVWQSERDACVYCLALSGEVVGSGEVFPDADLYAPQPKAYGAILEPPRHPNCRCTLAVLYDPGYADALQREAQRSILRGFALPSESNAVRIRAAERLLARDPVAPKSVKAFAAKAIKAGKFPTRDVPEGDPRLVIHG